MEIARPKTCQRSLHGAAVTIGAYDGVHLGHRYLLSHLCAMAGEQGLRSVVVTFDRHPASVVRPGSAPKLLTGLDQKLELLSEAGVDMTLVIPFDEQRSKEEAEDFVEEVLVDMLGTRLVVVGEDFHFGHGRKGNVALLSELGAKWNFRVDGIALGGAGSSAVSSTLIRAMIAAGDVAGAASLLGHPHRVRGVVVKGDQRGGAELGFPTANLSIDEHLAMPGIGIYAGKFSYGKGKEHMSAISIGHRPTFYGDGELGDSPPLLEAYLLDFTGDLYGKKAEVSFVKKLRDELRFDEVSDLKAQMAKDAEETRWLLQKDTP